MLKYCIKTGSFEIYVNSKVVEHFILEMLDRLIRLKLHIVLLNLYQCFLLGKDV